MDKTGSYLQRIRHIYPELPIQTAHLIGQGQFNEILLLNENLIFRFPKSAHAAEIMAYEVAALRILHDVITTLPVPHPVYVHEDDSAPDENFMGYYMLAGIPLSHETLQNITDESVLARCASQIGLFLHELHSVPASTLPIKLEIADEREEWLHTYQEFREKLFPAMRPDARAEVAQRFETFLDEPGNFAYVPTIRHGDFGGSNILYDVASKRISGIIDFSFVAIGDPAYDVASLSTLGNPFLQRVCEAYPEARQSLERASFYSTTFALLEALSGLRDGDRGSFESGLADYI